MKNKVFLNRININYKTLYTRAQDYFKRHGVDIQFDFIQSDYKNLSYRLADFGHGQRVILQPTMSQVVPLDPTYDFTTFMFNQAEFPPPNLPTGYCYSTGKQAFMDVGTNLANPKDLDYVNTCHELMHALTMKANLAGFPTVDQMDSYYKPMDLESADSNFGRQWVLLQPYINSLKSKPMYKYFKDSEVVGLKPEFVSVLDTARGIAAVPFIVTSGYRDPAHNQEVGGVMNSAHETGLAVDLLIKDTISGGKILKALQKVGLERFGFYNDGHLHVDMANDAIHPSPCYWVK